MNIRNILAPLIVALLVCLTACTQPAPPHGLSIPDVHEFLTAKYDSMGRQLWQQTEGIDSKYAFGPARLDQFGNSYIVGSNYGAKFDSNGKKIYSNTFEAGDLIPRKTVLDDQGNVYLIGDTNSSDQIVVFKFDDRGQQLWTRSYHYPGSTFTVPSDIALDQSGNVYVAGITSPSKDTTASNPLILKFDNNGNQLWVAKDEGLLTGGAIVGVAVDSSNLYLAGSTLSNSFNDDYVIEKFNPNGQKLWERSYNGTGNRFDVPHAIIVGPDGNVVVTGESDGGVREIATIKYDQDGNQLWVSRYNSANGAGGTPSAMTFDNLGNIYITGRGFNVGLGDTYLTVKYDSNGQLLWDAWYSDVEGSLNEATALYVDGAGNVYVTGHCLIGSASGNFETLKYDANGQKMWVAKSAGTYFTDSPTQVIADASGNVYVIGPVSFFSSDLTTISTLRPNPNHWILPTIAAIIVLIGAFIASFLVLRSSKGHK